MIPLHKHYRKIPLWLALMLSLGGIALAVTFTSGVFEYELEQIEKKEPAQAGDEAKEPSTIYLKEYAPYVGSINQFIPWGQESKPNAQIWKVTKATVKHEYRINAKHMTGQAGDVTNILEHLRFVTELGNVNDKNYIYTLHSRKLSGGEALKHNYAHLYESTGGQLTPSLANFQNAGLGIDPFFNLQAFLFTDIGTGEIATTLQRTSLGQTTEFKTLMNSPLGKKFLYQAIGNIYLTRNIGEAQAYVYSDEHVQAAKDFGNKADSLYFLMHSKVLLTIIGGLSTVMATYATFQAMMGTFFAYLKEVFAFPNIIEESSYEERTIVRIFNTVRLGRPIAWVLDTWYGKGTTKRIRRSDFDFEPHNQRMLETQITHYESIIKRNVDATRRGKPLNLPLGNLLLAGSPGTGKTMMITYIAQRLRAMKLKNSTQVKALCHFVKIPGANFSMLSEEQVTATWQAIDREALAEYRRTGMPTFVLMDEVEQAIISHVAGDGNRKDRLNTAKLLTLFNGKMGTHLIVLGTTNIHFDAKGRKQTHAEELGLDEAMLNRFLHIYTIDPPKAPRIWSMLQKKSKAKAKELDMEMTQEALATLEELWRDDYFEGAVGRDIDGWTEEVIEYAYVHASNLKKRRKRVTAKHILEKIAEEQAMQRPEEEEEA